MRPKGGEKRIMKVRVDKLRKALIILEPVVPKKKPTIPITAMVRLHDGMVTGTNLETAVSVNLPEAIEDCMLPYKKALELLKYVPGNDTLTIEPVNKLVKLSWGDGVATYPSDDPKDFPGVTAFETVSEAPVNGDILIPAMVEMAKYAATETSRPVLNAVNLLLGNTIDVAGADGFRLAFKSLPLRFPTEENINITLDAVSILEHLWKHAPSRVPLKNDLISQITSARLLNLAIVQFKEGTKSKSLFAQFGDVKLISQLVEGNFPNYKQLVPDTTGAKSVQVFAEDLRLAVKRIERIAKDSSSIVRFSWADTFMVVAAHSEEDGDVEARIKVQPGAVPSRVAISVKYISEYLKGRSGLVTMTTTGDGKGPVVFEHGNSPKVCIMPMFVQWGDEPKEAAATPETTETQAAAEDAILQQEPADEVPGTGETEENEPGSGESEEETPDGPELPEDFESGPEATEETVELVS